MSVFPAAAHLASWAGLCPGQRESAGKHGSNRTRPGNRWLRTILVQAEWAASHTKDTYLAAQYHRLVGRRGTKRALMAVAHTQLVIAYHLPKSGTTYRELGADYFDRLDPDRATRKLVKRLEQLGHTVTPRAGGSLREHGVDRCNGLEVRSSVRHCLETPSGQGS